MDIYRRFKLCRLCSGIDLQSIFRWRLMSGLRLRGESDSQRDGELPQGFWLQATAALIGFRAMRSHAPVASSVTQVSSVVVVSGPQPEVANGSPLQDITVGPSPALAMHDADWRYGEGVVGRGPSKVTIVGSLNPPANQDSNRH